MEPIYFQVLNSTEIVYEILKYLPWPYLYTCGLVSKLWAAIRAKLWPLRAPKGKLTFDGATRSNMRMYRIDEILFVSKMEIKARDNSLRIYTMNYYEISLRLYSKWSEIDRLWFKSFTDVYKYMALVFKEILIYSKKDSSMDKTLVDLIEAYMALNK
jgi:hypothetical protein